MLKNFDRVITIIAVKKLGRTEAAKQLGIGVRTLTGWLRKWGYSRRQKPDTMEINAEHLLALRNFVDPDFVGDNEEIEDETEFNTEPQRYVDYCPRCGSKTTEVWENPRFDPKKVNDPLASQKYKWKCNDCGTIGFLEARLVENGRSKKDNSETTEETGTTDG